MKKVAAFTPYFTEDEAGQVRAAFLAAGHLEGDASVSDFIVRATMREVKRLQRRHNQGRTVGSCSGRCAAPRTTHQG